jgi:ABC-type antimicrobial peptide transport system ATPase subunit
MFLQDIKAYEKAIDEASRVIKNRSRFAFSVPYPCFEIKKYTRRQIILKIPWIKVNGRWNDF